MSSTCFLKFVVLMAGLQATTCEATDTNCNPVLLKTNSGAIQVGCVYTCSSQEERVPLSKDGEECIDFTHEDARNMQNQLEYHCPVGRCSHGTCRRTGATVGCWYMGNDHASG
ncbi:hypothetical protein V5799_012528 [Amblyomma americanum]|uniref:Evasin n=1 Tax=Amblyomma americanum TaxID=6943 RepID=A0AAQ4EDS4_AMBAM